MTMQPDPRLNRKLLRQINAQKARIAKERDKLRDLIAELDDIDAGMDDAVNALDHAADAMSRLI